MEFGVVDVSVLRGMAETFFVTLLMCVSVSSYWDREKMIVFLF